MAHARFGWVANASLIAELIPAGLIQDRIHPVGFTIVHAPLLIRHRQLPKTFELRAPEGRIEIAELNPPADLTDDWTLEFENTGASINSTYDHTARAALGRYDSFEVFPPVSLNSTTHRGIGAWPQPYTALARVWAYLMGASGETLGPAAP